MSVEYVCDCCERRAEARYSQYGQARQPEGWTRLRGAADYERFHACSNDCAVKLSRQIEHARRTWRMWANAAGGDAVSKTKKPVRLACVDCDTDAGDGITLAEAKSQGWTEVYYVGRVRIKEDDDSRWWTHLGSCRECTAKVEAAWNKAWIR